MWQRPGNQLKMWSLGFFILNIFAFISRLQVQAYDRNTNFGAADVQQPEFAMELPPLAEFKYLHGGMTMPPFTMAELQDFLHLQNASLGDKIKTLYDVSYYYLS
jgi:hypothetical protein